jgi:integrase
MKKRLTALSVENLKPGPVRREVPDGNRLYLVLQPSGAKSWAVRYRFAGKPRKLTLGPLSLAAARAEAAKALLELDHGRDPGEIKKAVEAKAEESAAATVRAVAAEYMRLAGKDLRTHHERQGIINRLILPTLGNKPIAEVKRGEIVRLLDRIEHENGARTAEMVLRIISKIFNWYAVRSDDFRSPLTRGMSRINARERARTRILDDAELRAVWQAAGDVPFGSLLRFLLLTGARRSEATGLQWSELDASGVWMLPASRNKTKQELVRPLSKAARTLLAQVPVIGPFVFTSKGQRGLTGISESKRLLDAASGVTAWTIHDLRRTSRTLLARAGVNSDICERCLGHTLPTIRATYDRYTFQREMLDAYEKLASLISGIVDPQENVVAIRG